MICLLLGLLDWKGREAEANQHRQCGMFSAAVLVACLVPAVLVFGCVGRYARACLRRPLRGARED